MILLCYLAKRRPEYHRIKKTVSGISLLADGNFFCMLAGNR